jgi:hypothetical protein
MCAMSPRLLRPRASGFDPRSIAGLLLWLDGADQQTMGSANTGPGGVSDNGPVRYWGDKSGNNRNATNALSLESSPTFKAAFLNGKSVLGFDGGDFLTGSYASGGLSIPQQTTFGVIRYDSSATVGFARVFSQNASSVQVGSGTGEVAGYIPIIRDGSTNDFGGYKSGVTLPRILGGVTLTSGNWVAIQTRFKTTSGDTRAGLGSYSVSGTVDAYEATFDDYFVSISGAGFASEKAEFLVYNSSLSDGDANKVMRYLLRKWGI